MTKLVKPHPHTPRTNSHTKEHTESKEEKEPKESKAIAFPTNDVTPSSTPSKTSKFRRSAKLSTSSTSSDDNHEAHDALRLRKPSLFKTVKRVSTKQLRSISSTLSNSAHRITLHGHGHHIDHSSESSESSQLSEPSHLSQSFDSSHLVPSSHSSVSSEHSELAEPNSPTKDARRRRVSLPSFRLLRPSSFTRSRTGSSVGSPSSTATTSVPTVPAHFDLGAERSYSIPSVSTERNQSTVLSPVLSSASVAALASAATPTSPTPMADPALSADGGSKNSRAASLIARDDLYRETDAQETQHHPPGLTISVELVQTSPINGVETVEVPSVPSVAVSDKEILDSPAPPLPPLPSSSRSVTSLSSFFSYTLHYTLPASPSSNHYSWTDDIDDPDGSGDESEDEGERMSDNDSDDDIEMKKNMVKADSHRVSKGPFISSVFILVPVLSVRRPIGYYLNWWLGRNA